MKYNHFLVTIKSRGDPYTTQEELVDFYDRIKEYIKDATWSDVVTYEITASNRLHMHTILQLPKKYMWSRLLKEINFNLGKKRLYCHLAPFPSRDYNIVRNYITKQCSNEYVKEQILLENFYYNNYGFESNSLIKDGRRAKC